MCVELHFIFLCVKNIEQSPQYVMGTCGKAHCEMQSVSKCAIREFPLCLRISTENQVFDLVGKKLVLSLHTKAEHLEPLGQHCFSLPDFHSFPSSSTQFKIFLPFSAEKFLVDKKVVPSQVCAKLLSCKTSFMQNFFYAEDLAFSS